MIDIQPIYDNEGQFSVFSHWDGGDITLTPVHFEKGGKRHFIVNVHGSKTDDLNFYVQQLSQNDGKYFCFYCHYHEYDIRKFLDIVKSKKWHFQDAKFDIHGDWVDFHGNIKEFSCAFMYRIYDMDMFADLKREYPRIKVRKL